MSKKSNNHEDTVVLSYHDSLLRNGDVDLLRGRHWLNDAIIGFYFEYLQNVHDDASGDNQELYFVSPQLTQLLKLTDVESWCDLIGPPSDEGRSYVLFPLNNCESRDAAGGSHWSLLVYSAKEQISFHLDCCRGTNRSAAAQFAKKVMKHFSGSVAKDFVEEMQCPQQENGYDCGLFALCLADSIVRQIPKVRGLKNFSFNDVPSRVRVKREDLLVLIEQLNGSRKLEK